MSKVKNETLYGTAGADTLTTGAGDDKIYARGGNNVVNAGDGDNSVSAESGNDRVTTGSGDDRIEAGDGNNVINAGDGRNMIDAGSGDDIIDSGNGDDEIDAGNGRNVIRAGAGRNAIVTGTGADDITSGAGNDTVSAGDGDNRIAAGDGVNSVTAGKGNDTISTGSGNDTIRAGDGNNVVSAGDGKNLIYAGSGNDTITTGAGSDSIFAGDGANIINAGNGDNRVESGRGADRITTGSDDDTISSGAGDDVIAAGAGNDEIDAGDGNDSVDAGAGHDSIDGGSGNDVIVGGAGHDLIRGGSGNDILDGGADEDAVFGEDGDDVAIFRVAEHGNGYLPDVYDGGSGNDTLRLVLTRAEYMGAGMQADIARYLAVLNASNWSLVGLLDVYNFQSIDLFVSRFEKLELVVDGVLVDPRDAAVTAIDDQITATEDAAGAAVDLLANDSVPDLVKGLTFTQPEHGSVTVTFTPGAAPTARAVYTPNATYYQYLAAGERATDRFTYTVTDSDGDAKTATVTVTITGVNDGPLIVSGKTATALVEGPAVLTDTGTILFSDLDLTDSHTVAVGVARVTGAAPAGGFGTLTAAVVENTADQNNQGGIVWIFRADDAQLGRLAAGQIVTQAYTLTLTDRAGASVTRDVTITLTGANDAPTVTSAVATGAVVEDGATTATGTIAFADIDLTDSHAVAVAARGTGYVGTLVATLTDAATGDGAGAVRWNFAADNAALQALAQGEILTQDYTVTVTDSNGAKVEQVVTIAITGVNDAPVARGDTASAIEGGALLTGSVATNDSDADRGAVLSYALTAPVAGLTLQAGGSYSFDPDNAAYQALTDGDVRTIVAGYTVTDDKGATTASTLTITLTGVNDAPVANPDVVSVTEGGGPVTISLIANDTDAESNRLFRAFVDDRIAGLQPGPITTLPLTFDPNDPAYDHLAAGQRQTIVTGYTLLDDANASARSTLTIIVTGTNDAPVAVADSASGGENETLTIDALANDTDVDDGHVLTLVSASTQPGQGSATIVGNRIVFNPGTDFDRLADGDTATVVVGYTMKDEFGAISSSTLTIAVRGVNDAPVANPDVVSVTEGGAPVTISLIANDTDAEANRFLRAFTDDQIAGLQPGPITNLPLTFDPNDPAYDYLAAGQRQTIVTGYTLLDDANASARSTLTIIVTGTNDALVLGAAATGTLVEQPGQTGAPTIDSAQVSLALRDVDLIDTHSVTVAYVPGSAVFTNVSVIPADIAAFLSSPRILNAVTTALVDTTGTGTGQVTATFAAPDATFDSLPQGGSLSLQYLIAVSDGQGGSAERIVTFVVTGANDGPVVTSGAAAASGTAIEAGATGTGTPAATGTLTASDADVGATAIWSGGGNGVYGSFAITAAGAWTYTLDNSRTATNALGAGQPATDSFLATVTDDRGATATQQVTVTITGANDAPVVAGAITAVIDEDAGRSTLNALAKASDTDTGTTLSVMAPSALPLGVTYDAASKAFTLDTASYQSLARGASQVVTVDYAVTDGIAQTAASASWTIRGQNDAPVVTGPVTAAIAEGAAPSTLAALTNASDVDAGAILEVLDIAPLPAGVTYDAATKAFTLDPRNGAYDALGAGQSRVVTVAYKVGDGDVRVDASVSWTVTGVNDAPTAPAQRVSSKESDAAVTVDALFTAKDIDSPALAAVVNTSLLPAGISYDAATHRFTLNAADPAIQALAHGEIRNIVVNYLVADETTFTPTSLTWTVTGENDAPVAVADTFSGDEGGLISLPLLQNDTDIDTGAQLRVVAINGAAIAPDGTVSVTGGSVSMLPNRALVFRSNENVSGLVSFTYTVSDERGATSVATAKITVAAVNNAPEVSGPIIVNTNEDAILSFVDPLANATDADSPNLRVVNVGPLPAGVTYKSGAFGGSFDLNPSDAAYQSLAAGETRTVSVAYAVSDGSLSTPASIVWNIAGVNDAPIARDDAFAVDEDEFASLSLTANDTDIDAGARLTVTRINGQAVDTVGTVDIGGGTLLLSGNRALYTPGANVNGVFSFTYTLSDEYGATSQATATVTVRPVNDAPTVNGSQFFAVGEDSPPSVVNALARASDIDGDTLRVANIGALPAGVTFDAATNRFALDPTDPVYQALTAGQIKIVTVDYAVSDGQRSTPTSITWQVLGANEILVANDDIFTVAEDNPLILNLRANDTDSLPNAQLTVQQIDGTTVSVGSRVAITGGSLSMLADGNFLFLPSENYVGAPSFRYAVVDQYGSTSTATATIAVTPVNDTPVVNGIVAVETIEDSAVRTVNALVNASDVDNSTLFIRTVGALPAGVTFDGPRNFTLDPSDAAYQSLGAGQTRLVAVGYQVSDGIDSVPAVLQWTIRGVNDAPVAGDDTLSTNKNQAISFTLAGNDRDVDLGDILTVTAIDGRPVAAGDSIAIGGGTLEVRPGGGFNFAPATNATGTVSFGYTVSDGHGGSDDATATITVRPFDYAPVQSAQPFVLVYEPDAPRSINALTNVTDADSTQLDIVNIGALPAGVSYDPTTRNFTLDPHNTAYDLLNEGDSRNVVATYSVTDGVNTVPASVRWVVLGINDAPVAVNDMYTTLEDMSMDLPLVANDRDVDSPYLFVTYIGGVFMSDGAVATVTGGTVTRIDNATVRFTPNADFSGTVSFNYTLSDQYAPYGTGFRGLTDTATVTITIQPVNDAPVQSVQPFVLVYEPDAPRSINALTNVTDVDSTQLNITNIGALPAGVSYDPVTRNFTLDPGNAVYGVLNQGDSRNVTATYSVTDGVTTTPASVRWVVLGVNDAPVAVDDVFTTAEETPVTLSLTANDRDVDNSYVFVTYIGNVFMSVGAVATVNGGTVARLDDGSLQFNLNADVTGTVSFTYTVSDQNAPYGSNFRGLTDTATVSITITPVNDSPVQTSATPIGVTEDGAPSTISALANIVDIDGDTLSIGNINLPAGVAYHSGNFTLDPSLAFFQHLAAGETETVTVRYTVSDGAGVIPASIRWIVTGVNDAPVANDDEFLRVDNTPIVLNVLANDSDVDSPFGIQRINGTSLHLPTQITGGTLTAGPNGTLIFTPAADAPGRITFEYSAYDGTAYDTATVTILKTLLSGNGDDRLVGTSLDELIRGLRGDDVMTGGGGNDIFSFSANSGRDTITDFSAGPGAGDVIELIGTGITSFAQLQAQAFDDRDGVHIGLSIGNEIILTGVTLASLSADDFVII